MPLEIVPRSNQYFERLRDQVRTAAPIETLRGEAPWLGYVPDLPAQRVGINGAQLCQNVVAKVDQGQQGEILTQPPGYTVVDPNTTWETNVEANFHASSENVATMIGWFPRTNSDGLETGNQGPTLLMATAGDGSTADSGQLWRIEPTSGDWQEITHDVTGGSLALTAGYPGSVTAQQPTPQLIDWAAAPFGATPRTGLAAFTPTEPCFVFTNYQDAVYIYPGEQAAAGDEKYQELTLAFNAKKFYARSVELWGDRLNFFNTQEDDVIWQRRLRRTAIGNCDPDPTEIGSGFQDLDQFSGAGLRVETLGDMLACYLTDGMAVARRTGNRTQPYHIEIITKDRGLLSTHSVTPIGGGRHFGIFTDGFFIVDTSGQFREVGLSNLDGAIGSKFKQAFFDRINLELVDRIHMTYDQRYQWIYITAPFDGLEEENTNREVWIYDITSDRIWPQTYGATVFGHGSLVTQAGLEYGDLDGGYDDWSGTYGDASSRYGLAALLHGNNGGVVMQYDYDIITRDSDVVNDPQASAIPGFVYSTVISPIGNPRGMKTVREVLLEHVRSSGVTAIVRVYEADGGSSNTMNYTWADGQMGQRIQEGRGFSISGSQLQLNLTSSGELKLCSIEVDLVGRRARRVQGV